MATRLPKAPADIAALCERHFQSGCGKVQVIDACGMRTSTAVDLSAKRALELAYPGEQVFARRKVDERSYGWVLVGTGAA